MKALCLVFALAAATALAGCSSKHFVAKRNVTADEASRIARDAANKLASAHYHTRPFLLSTNIALVNGAWLWRDRRPYGTGDIEANVVVSSNGVPHSVDVKLLDSRANAF